MILNCSTKQPVKLKVRVKRPVSIPPRSAVRLSVKVDQTLSTNGEFCLWDSGPTILRLPMPSLGRFLSPKYHYPAPGWRSQPPSPWWGGAKMTPPPLTRKLEKLEGRAIRRSTALSEPVRSHFGHFFAQVNIEVSRGHQRSNFRKMTVLSGMPAIISGTIIATPNPKKAQDSS